MELPFIYYFVAHFFNRTCLYLVFYIFFILASTRVISLSQTWNSCWSHTVTHPSKCVSDADSRHGKFPLVPYMDRVVGQGLTKSKCGLEAFVSTLTKSRNIQHIL